MNPKIDVGISSTGYVRAKLGYYRRGYEFTFEGEVLAPRDPNVEIEVLEPGTSRDLLLDTAHEVLYDELGDLGMGVGQSLEDGWSSSNPHYRYLVSALHHVDSFLGRRYVDFAISGETRFTATSDKPRPVSLTVRGDGPVRLLFALQVHDRDAGTSSISEFMPVVVTEARLA